MDRPTPRRAWPWAAALFLASLACAGGAAWAHPHVWVEVRSTLHFDEAGRIDAVGQSWRFDEDYSDYALGGIDVDEDGVHSAAELEPLRADLLATLPESRFLTAFTVDGLDRNLRTPADLTVAAPGQRFEVSFTLPVEEPVDPRRHEVTLATYDPTYFVALDLAAEQPVRLTGPVPDGCRAAVRPPGGAQDQVMLGDDLAVDLDLARSFALDFTSTVSVRCGP